MEQKPKRLPTMLTREQAHAIIAALSGDNQLVARLLYGSGLRLLEALRLRVKDRPTWGRLCALGGVAQGGTNPTLGV